MELSNYELHISPYKEHKNRSSQGFGNPKKEL